MKYAIGLMSGTSFDGLDIAICKISGVNQSTKLELVFFETINYDNEMQATLKQACDGKMSIRQYCSLNTQLSVYWAQLVNQTLKKYNLKNQDIEFIASHGQTIYHLIDPVDKEYKSTLQLGDGSILANLTDINVVSDFRMADIAHNGQGAPIVPFSELILYSQINENCIFQNIGGISNSTYIKKGSDHVLAFDNGPGNVLINYAAKQLFNMSYDKDGIQASKGKVNNEIIDYLNNDPYYQVKPPKSTGREKYNIDFINKLLLKFKDINKHDILRSLTYFSAKKIIDSYQDFIITDNKTTYTAIIAGGGSSNCLLLDDLNKLAPSNLLIKKAEDVGINSDAKEAVAMVVLANQTLNHQTSNLPSATGATKSAILGKVSYIK